MQLNLEVRAACKSDEKANNKVCPGTGTQQNVVAIALYSGTSLMYRRFL